MYGGHGLGQCMQLLPVCPFVVLVPRASACHGRSACSLGFRPGTYGAPVLPFDKQRHACECLEMYVLHGAGQRGAVLSVV